MVFHKPNKDLCDLCQEYKNKEDDQKILQHREIKLLTKQERKCDLAKVENGDYKTTAVISFDLEKVIPLPIANISAFYYKRKLNCYNFTAHCSLNNKTYCALWNESIAGRGANELASCLYKLLKLIIQDCPNISINQIILWSDSCVPQNKNSIVSMAIKNFKMKAEYHSLNRSIIQYRILTLRIV